MKITRAKNNVHTPKVRKFLGQNVFLILTTIVVKRSEVVPVGYTYQDCITPCGIVNLSVVDSLVIEYLAIPRTPKVLENAGAKSIASNAVRESGQGVSPSLIVRAGGDVDDGFSLGRECRKT